MHFKPHSLCICITCPELVRGGVCLHFPLNTSESEQCMKESGISLERMIKILVCRYVNPSFQLASFLSLTLSNCSVLGFCGLKGLVQGWAKFLA